MVHKFFCHTVQSFKFPAIYISRIHKILIRSKENEFEDWLIENSQAPISFQSHRHDSEVQRVFQKVVKIIGSFPVRRIKVPHFFVKSKFRTFSFSLYEFPMTWFTFTQFKGCRKRFASSLAATIWAIYLCKWSSPWNIQFCRMYVSTSANEPVFPWSSTLYSSIGFIALATNELNINLKGCVTYR